MASTKNYLLSCEVEFGDSDGVEFEESDIWNGGDGRVRLISQASLESHLKKQIPAPRSWKKSSSGRKISGSRSSYSAAIQAPSSMPVNIPDWSKIQEVGEDPDIDLEGSDDEDPEEDWLPPHEYAARQLAKRTGKVVAFSVQEGTGGTLKGRHLYRLRNAIWKQTGFQD